MIKKNINIPVGIIFVIIIMAVCMMSACEKEEDEDPDDTTDVMQTGLFTDPRDGNEYRTVKIGNQWWMAENLKYLPDVKRPGYGSAIVPFYYVYNYMGYDTAEAKVHSYFQVNSYKTYGALYNWPAAVAEDTSSTGNIQGVCPQGWHLPSDQEWKQLEMHLGMTAVEADATGWRGSFQGCNLATDTLWTEHVLTQSAETGLSGFDALPGGYRHRYGTFVNQKTEAMWWSSTSDTAMYAWGRYLSYNFTRVYRISAGRERGFSVRCVKD